MEKDSRFWNRLAKRYARSPVQDEPAYQKKLQISRDYFRDDMEILEIGCGTGTTAIAQSPYVKNIQAIDFSAKMLDFARDKAKASGVSNVTFEQADIDSLAYPENSFDAVMAHSILHLLEDKEKAILNIFRVLKPGGVFISSTPCMGDTMNYFKYIAPIGRFVGLLPVLGVFTAKNLENSISDAGFSIDHLWNVGKGKAVFIVAIKPDY